MIFFPAMISTLSAGSIINIIPQENNSFYLEINPLVQENYGCKYPITYEFTVSNLDSAFSVVKTWSRHEPGDAVPLRSRTENFNGVEALRLDITHNKVYLSVGFTDLTNFLEIDFPDHYEIVFDKISKYYDDRSAVVTSSLDDVQGWKKDISSQSGRIFQQYQIWLTMGFITDGIGRGEVDLYQPVINDGYIEIASHSRSHPDPAPYGNKLVGEISGNKQDLIDDFIFPDLFRRGDKEYVYTWIAPNGYRDDPIDSLLAAEHYLVNRLYRSGYNGMGDWNEDLLLFQPVGMSGEIGHTSWYSSATTDTLELKNRFDRAYNAGEVYHFMFHPQSIDWNERYGHQHLEYLSGREDVWYVALGHLYLYELMSNNEYTLTEVEITDNKVPEKLHLEQNFPNPFNPTTTINYSIPTNRHVNITLYDILGNRIKTLIDEKKMAGYHSVLLDAFGLPSGVYFYKLSAENFSLTKKCILVK